jgi:hypothetical protein
MKRLGDKTDCLTIRLGEGRFEADIDLALATANAAAP